MNSRPSHRGRKYSKNRSQTQFDPEQASNERLFPQDCPAAKGGEGAALVRSGRAGFPVPAVPDARCGRNESLAQWIIAELSTEMSDIHPEILGVFGAIGSPDLFENVSVCEDLAGIPNQQEEERVFGGRQPYLLLPLPYPP